MALIKHGKVVEDDPWTLVGDDEPVPGEGDVIVGVGRFLRDDALRARSSGRTGVRIDPTDEIDDIHGAVEKAPVVAIHFPKFADGRGYTKARILRERYGYQGELRAVGDVLADQLFYMQRCGIDSFALKEGKDPQSAIQCLSDLSVTYQGAADDPRPLYRRGR